MSEPRKRRRPRGKGCRNLLLFALIIAGIGGLIVAVATMSRAPRRIMPPEPPEMAAKRTSPDNAFIALMNGYNSIRFPEPPEPIKAPSQFNTNRADIYEPPPGSIAALVGVPRPDTDPAVGQFLADCRPVVENARAALAKGYFLYPEIPSGRNYPLLERHAAGGRLNVTLDVLVASMAYAARQKETEEQALEYFSDALRLVEMTASDGGIDLGFFVEMDLRLVLQYAADSAAHIDSPEILRAMRDKTEAIAFHRRPLEPGLEFLWRTIDKWAERGYIPPDGKRQVPINQMIEMWWLEWQFRRHCRLIRKNKDVLLSIAEQCSSRKAFEERIESDPAAKELWRRFPFGHGAMLDIRSALGSRDEMEATRLTAVVAFSIELYRRGHGAYPETLDALVPDYLPAIPTTPAPVTKDSDVQALFYRAEGDRESPGAYWLYPGPDRTARLSQFNEEALRYEAFHTPPEEVRSQPASPKNKP